MDFYLLKTLAPKKLKAKLQLLTIIWLACILPPPAFASSFCEIGDETKGYWAMVGDPYHGECKIPGPPDSLSDTTVRGFRVEGKYKVVGTLSGKGFYLYQPTCEPECIKGMAEKHCSEGYGFESDGLNCLMPDWNQDGKPDGYACFSDANHITLYEWQWLSDECNSLEKPNRDTGKPCPLVPAGQ